MLAFTGTFRQLFHPGPLTPGKRMLQNPTRGHRTIGSSPTLPSLAADTWQEDTATTLPVVTALLIGIVNLVLDRCRKLADNRRVLMLCVSARRRYTCGFLTDHAARLLACNLF